MLNLIISLLILLFSAPASAKSFEGSIDFVYESHYDTSFFTYYVKNDQVRIDKFDNNHLLVQSLLIHMGHEELYVLSPSKKLYTKLERKQTDAHDQENFIVQKTENHREVNGIDCYQWRVKNIERNTEIAYWVSQNDFYFFEDLIKLINHTDKTYDFFEKIPESQGFFPLLAVERTLLRKEKSRIYVANITKKSISDSMFTIPADYQLINP